MIYRSGKNRSTMAAASWWQKANSDVDHSPVGLTLLLEPPGDTAGQWQWIRTQLADAFNLDITELAVEREARGKPRIRGLDDKAPFSLARRPGLLLLGTGKANRIGVDLEILDPSLNWLAIARSFFHASEADVLAEMRSEERIRAFSAAWVIKEAVLKAVGCGIGQGLALPRIATEVLIELGRTEYTGVRVLGDSVVVDVLRIDVGKISRNISGPLFVAAATTWAEQIGAADWTLLRLKLDGPGTPITIVRNPL